MARKFYNFKVKEYLNGERVSVLYTDSVEYGQAVAHGTRGESISPEESIRTSLQRTKQNIIDLSKNNNWDYFVTITFDKTKIDRYDYDLITTKLSKRLQNLKYQRCPGMAYILVPELHEDGAYHFHGLFANIENLKIVQSGLKTADGKIIFNIEDFNLGFTTATKITDTKKASFYISKYVTKDLITKTFNKKRYWCSQNLVKPKETIYLLSNNLFEEKEKELAESSLVSRTYSYSSNSERAAQIKYFYN
jgi:hypothetical protein